MAISAMDTEGEIRILLLAYFSLPYSDYEVSINGTSRKQPLLTMSDLIEEEEIEGLLKKVPEWDHENKSITRSVEFAEFMEAIDFVNAVAEIAEDAGHHPDIDVRWTTVVLALTTHDAGGLTDSDFEVARKIDTLID